MRRNLPVLAALLSLLGSSTAVHADQRDEPSPTVRRASLDQSRIAGIVTDQAGNGIVGVSVLAMGTTLAMARSDEGGRFTMAVPAGEYVLRATRDGYVSTYREAVRVRSDIPLLRRITLFRADSDLASAVTSGGNVEPAADPPGVTTPVSLPNESVWRLRHLPRTVLRERSSAWWRQHRDEEEPSTPDGFGRDLRGQRASRALSSFWGAPDLDGHVDFLTTSSLAASGVPSLVDWPRGIAYVVLGAPVGNHGDWLVRAAMTSNDASAWTFVGEYSARQDQRHAFRTGVSYSAHTLPGDSFERVSIAAPNDIRRVGGVYGSDRMNIGGGLELGLGGRLDRVDYLGSPNLMSGSVDVRQRLTTRTTVTLVASHQMVAPGADQFRPPSASGVWLPPERTFSSLDASRALRPEAIERYDFGVEGVLRGEPDGARSSALTLRLRRFSEHTTNQIATLFGLDDESQVGHYYFSSPGSVRVEGWGMGLAGALAPHVRGSVDYAMARAVWTGEAEDRALTALARSAARQGTELGHDITSSLEATLPSTATAVTMVMRLNSLFSNPPLERGSFGGRFAIEVRQPLPFQPLERSVLNLVVAARTLLNDLDAVGSFYDDLLTVAPPLRLTCGIQMRF